MFSRSLPVCAGILIACAFVSFHCVDVPATGPSENEFDIRSSVRFIYLGHGTDTVSYFDHADTLKGFSTSTSNSSSVSGPVVNNDTVNARRIRNYYRRFSVSLDAPASILIDDKSVASLSFGDATPYLNSASGYRKASVSATGLFIDTMVTIAIDSAHHVAHDTSVTVHDTTVVRRDTFVVHDSTVVRDTTIVGRDTVVVNDTLHISLRYYIHDTLLVRTRYVVHDSISVHNRTVIKRGVDDFTKSSLVSFLKPAPLPLQSSSIECFFTGDSTTQIISIDANRKMTILVSDTVLAAGRISGNTLRYGWVSGLKLIERQTFNTSFLNSGDSAGVRLINFSSNGTTFGKKFRLKEVVPDTSTYTLDTLAFASGTGYRNAHSGTYTIYVYKLKSNIPTDSLSGVIIEKGKRYSVTALDSASTFFLRMYQDE